MYILPSMVPLDSVALLRRAMGSKVSQARPSLVSEETGFRGGEDEAHAVEL